MVGRGEVFVNGILPLHLVGGEVTVGWKGSLLVPEDEVKGVVGGEFHDDWTGLPVFGWNGKGMVDWEGWGGLEAGMSPASFAKLRMGRMISFRTMLGMEAGGVLLSMGSPWKRMVEDLDAWSSLITCSESLVMASSFLASSILAAASSSLTAVFSTRSSYMDFSMLSILLQIWERVALMAARVASIVGGWVGEGGSWLFFWGPI
jgi:hypothetical protein